MGTGERKKISRQHPTWTCACLGSHLLTTGWAATWNGISSGPAGWHPRAQAAHRAGGAQHNPAVWVRREEERGLQFWKLRAGSNTRYIEVARQSKLRRAQQWFVRTGEMQNGVIIRGPSRAVRPPSAPCFQPCRTSATATQQISH